LIPDRDKKSRPDFDSLEEYGQFRKEFRESIAPETRAHQRARTTSEEAARHHCIPCFWLIRR
jgi:hypothetical protein